MPQAPLLLAADLSAREILTCPTFWGLLLGAIGLWFLIPGGPRRFKTFGGVLAAIGMVCLFADLGRIGGLSSQIMFWLMAGITLLAAVGAISSQSPVYSAVWFALSLLGTSGIFLMQGALFLGVATIVVYAGAIVVTFLFVLMLAQPEGHATYDRISWGSAPTALGIIAAGALVGLLTHSLSELKRTPGRHLPVASVALLDQQPPVDAASVDSDAAAPPRQVPAIKKLSVQQPQHMASLGRELFTRQLIAVEIGGTLLLVALVGAVGMVIQGKLSRQEQET